MSLLSYRESEKEDPKYYDAEELVDIIGSQIVTKSSKEKKAKSPTKGKSK